MSDVEETIVTFQLRRTYHSLPKSGEKLTFVALALLVVSLLVGCADDSQQNPPPNLPNANKVAEPQHAVPSTQPSAKNAGESKQVTQPTLSSEKSTDEPQVVRSKVEPTTIINPYSGSAGLRERIFDSDVIAMVRLLGTAATTDTAGSKEDGSAIYRGLVTFRFEVLKYLKGSGGDELAADAVLELKSEVIRRILDGNARGQFVHLNDIDMENPYTTSEDALEAAEFWEQERDTTWDGREAIIFVKEMVLPGSSEGSTQLILGSIHSYALDGTYRSWLPSAVEFGVKDSGEGVAPDSMRFLLEPPNRASPQDMSETASVQPVTTSVSEIETLIITLERWRMEGEGVEGHLECILASFAEERLINGYKERGESLSTAIDFYLDSGLPTGYVIEDGHPVDGRDGRVWIEGKDKALFSYGDGAFRTVRPLPTGKYLVYYNRQAPRFIPCNYYPGEYKNRGPWFVNVSLPDRVLHEAFFDPVQIGSAVGAGASSGVLEPASFEVEGGTQTSIDVIAWESGQVRMKLSPSGTPVGHHVDFIALDGSVALRLRIEDAAQAVDGDNTTLTWDVCKQPWESGDKLMLRISESEADLTGETSDGECPSSNG